MEYYHNLITEESFKLLKAWQRQYDFVVIGGWAVWLWTKALKSKDIDLVISFETLAKLRDQFEVVKNDRLKKYEIKANGIDIDLYLPHYSNPGIAAWSIDPYVVAREGFNTPTPELLIILKQHAYQQRKNSLKGEKDKIDIIALLSIPEFNFIRYLKMANQYRPESIKELQSLLKETIQLPELNLNRQKFAKLKRLILNKLVGRSKWVSLPRLLPEIHDLRISNCHDT